MSKWARAWRKKILFLLCGGMTALVAPVFAQAPGEMPLAEVPPPPPGETLTWEFPDLPKTLAGNTASMQVRLPAAFDPKRKYPVFLWVGGWNGGNGSARTDLADADRYICIGLPLFKAELRGKQTDPNRVHLDYEDAPVLWKAWSAMLGRLEREYPNIQFGKGVAAGFSNGAHAIGLLLTERPKDMRRWFGAFVFVEGGYLLKSGTPVRGCPVLVLAGENNWARKKLGTTGSFAGDARQFASRVDADLIIMKDVGHDFPREYVPKVQEWLKRKGF